ncbi:hypothetical protein NW762_012603 [Fusarium torreyae]|uniref:Uncharacterized protein n=1 Tax=Fusarium torreyae TaxID=1237075 RepID=A0A9W8RNQ4_9HYPO|nr:hypothetical protein NW762_012603 [Fusarium torreyae]
MYRYRLLSAQAKNQNESLYRNPSSGNKHSYFFLNQAAQTSSSIIASLVPIDPKGITAYYHGLGRKLVLKAEGKIPGCFFLPCFEQDIWYGGLRFSIKAYSGGFAKLPDEQNFKFEFELPILLPVPHFNNRSVLVETAFSTSKINVVYIEWPESPEDEEVSLKITAGETTAPTSNSDKKSANTTSIVTPKDQGTLEIIALVAKELSSWVDIDFNPEFIKLASTYTSMTASSSGPFLGPRFRLDWLTLSGSISPLKQSSMILPFQSGLQLPTSSGSFSLT